MCPFKGNRLCTQHSELSHKSRKTRQKMLVSVVANSVLFFLFIAPAIAAQPQTFSWDVAQRISNNNFVSPDEIASNEQGDAIAVWTQDDGIPQEYGVWVRRYDHEAGWEQQQRINDYVGQADEVALAMNEDGQAVVAWVQYSLFDINNPAPTSTSLWVSQFSPDDGWSMPQLLVDGSVNPNFPNLAMSEQGNIILTWQQTNNDLDVTNIYATTYGRNTGWGKPVLIQSGTTINAAAPKISMNKHGDAVVVWEQYHQAPDFNIDLGFNYYTVQNGWIGAKSVPGSDEGNMPQAGIDEHGNAVIVYGTGYLGKIYAVEYNHVNGCGRPLLLQDPNNGSDISASNLQFAMNQSGEAFAIWKEEKYSYFSDTTYTIHVAQLLPGQAWQSQQRIGTAASNRTVYDQLVPQIGIDEAGNAIAVWDQETSLDFYAPTHILAFQYNKLSGWDAGQAIQQTAESANSVKLSVTENGQAFASWLEQDTTDFNGYTSLWVNRYSAMSTQ